MVVTDEKLSNAVMAKTCTGRAEIAARITAPLADFKAQV